VADPAGRGGFAGLDACVHCGFCLTACPTYLATGDESSSPRGRIVLMRALERGELDPGDDALRQHLGECLGCRGCEPACPSGVEYGRGLEAARERLARATRPPLDVRLLLWVFAHPGRWRLACRLARWIRASGLARFASGGGRVGFLAGMLDATRPRRPRPDARGSTVGGTPPESAARAGPRPRVALFRGCVMDGLFGHVHDAVRRTLIANGYDVVDPPGQTCCGALHAHAGVRDGARALARVNVDALTGAADVIAVDSAGCGAMLREYAELLPGDPRAAALAGRMRDVSQLLAERGPRAGAPLDVVVAYDPPCHLQHAQHVHAEALAVLAAAPGLDVRLLAGAERCCGAAGLYGVVHPELSRAVLADKVRSIQAADPRPDVVATGNPGCLMQIGAGLAASRLNIEVVHPVELLDRSYRRAGYY
jgi:glycolate oxidase iron-sulfur subunit